MTTTTPSQLPVPHAPERPRRKRRWLRWTIAGTALFIVLVVGLVAAAIKLQPTPEPLALPANASAPAGPVDGTYRPTSGSVAGFRIQQSVLGLASDVVGRTNDITGSVTIADSRAVIADLRVGLLALTSGDASPAPQFGISLDTQQSPDATIRLTQPIALDAAFASGTALTVSTAATLALHGVTRIVTVQLSLRRDGTNINVAGSIPIAFGDYGIAGPKGYGALGSLADHGAAEFLLVLHPS